MDQRQLVAVDTIVCHQKPARQPLLQLALPFDMAVCVDWIINACANRSMTL